MEQPSPAKLISTDSNSSIIVGGLYQLQIAA
jgi:hypothetical protein